MKFLADFKQSLIWHIVTGKYEVLDNGKLRKRKDSELKESGVPWIGEIPKEWETQRIKDLGKIKRGQYLDPKDFSERGEYPHLNGGRLSNERTNRFNSSETEITISTIGNSVGAINWPRTKFWAGNNCTKITAIQPRYTFELLKCFEENLARTANTSAQPFIQGKKLEGFQIPKWGETEIPKILAFLESLGTKLPDTSGVLQLIDQWYQSTIWHVVTGKYEVLNNGELRKRRTSELKDSNVPWIGKIPNNWETKRVKEVAHIKNGATPPTENGEFPVFGSNGKYETSAHYNYPEKTIIIGRKGSAGSVHIADTKCWVSDTALAVTGEMQNWLVPCLKLAPLETLTPTTTLPSLTINDLERLVLPTPTKAEEPKILAFLENLSEKTKALKENL